MDEIDEIEMSATPKWAGTPAIEIDMWRGLPQEKGKKKCVWRGLPQEKKKCIWRGLPQEKKKCIWRGLPRMNDDMVGTPTRKGVANLISKHEEERIGLLYI